MSTTKAVTTPPQPPKPPRRKVTLDLDDDSGQLFDAYTRITMPYGTSAAKVSEHLLAIGLVAAFRERRHDAKLLTPRERAAMRQIAIKRNLNPDTPKDKTK